MTSVTRTLTVFLALAGATAPLSGQSRWRDVSPDAVRTGFGSALAVAGGEIFVGRPGEFALFPMPAARAGGVHVYARDGGAWSEVAVVSDDEAEIGDGFGQAIGVSGNVLAVGAPKSQGTRGAVFVFERGEAGAPWQRVALLTAADGAAGDGFGQAVAVSDGAVLVGAPGNDGGRGAVYAFARGGDGRWTASEKLVPAEASAGGRLGHAVAAAGDRAILGAPGPFPGQMVGGPPQMEVGAAYVYRRDGGSGAWSEEARLEPGDPTVRTFGFAVSLAGDLAAASAPVVGGGAGAVLTFTRDAAGAWAAGDRLSPGDAAQGSLFGYAMAMTETHALVGAPGAGGQQGAARLFRRDEAGAWQEADQLRERLSGMIVFLGGAVALHDDVAAVGAPGADFFEGATLVYQRNAASGQWMAAGTPLIDESPGLEAVTGAEVECTGGEAGMFGCSEVDLVSFLPLHDLGAARGVVLNDIWGWTDPQTGTEYALVGRTDATAFVDLSNPGNPRYVGELPLTEGANVNLWRDIKVYRDHAFIVADGAGAHGVQVFDLRQLRDAGDAPVTFAETAHYSGIFSAHNIVIDESSGFAFAVGSSGGGETCGGGLHMIDIRDPANPTFAGCFSDPATGNARTGYSHDAQCLEYHGPDTEHAGKEICFGANETALSIADVSDKANPVALASASYPNVGYAHQGWVSDDHRYFFMNDELDELAGGAPRTRTMVWDIEDLDDPVLLTEYLGTTRASDHNLYVRGPYMYQSNYVSGLRVIDVSDPANLREVGYFDTVPFGEDVPGFAGSWSNYPFFNSGLVVVTSMREGLFVLKKREEVLVP